MFWNRRDTRDRGLYTISTVDGSSRQVAEAVLDPAGWSADGRWIYAVDREAQRLVRVPAEGGEIESIADLPFAPDLGYSTRDGIEFVVSVSGIRADAWMIENFDPGRE